jgi:hypothetical protein
MPKKLTKEERAAANKKLDAEVFMYLEGRRVGKRFAGGELPVRFADIAKALGRRNDDRALDRSLQRLKRAKKIRYSGRGGWEIWT